MASKIIEQNKKIADFLGLHYIPWNSTECEYPGWHYKDLPYYSSALMLYCRYHRELNFHCSVDRQDIFFRYLASNNVSFNIAFNSGEYTFSYKDKSFTSSHLPSAIYQAILNEFNLC